MTARWPLAELSAQTGAELASVARRKQLARCKAVAIRNQRPTGYCAEALAADPGAENIVIVFANEQLAALQILPITQINHAEAASSLSC